MDKLKPILAKLRKHHFWLLSGIVLLTGLIGWWVASGRLSLAYDTNKAKIVGKFSNLDSVLNTANHPNGTWTEALGKVTQQEKDIVRTAWETVYNEQKQHLTWPPELGDDFLDAIKSSKPEDEIKLDFRARYQDLIAKTEFPRLLAIVGLTEDASSKATASTPAATATSGQQNKAAESSDNSTDFTWESSSQGEVKKSLDFATTPSSAQVRQTQEDIWVYRALLQIIRAMNEKQVIPVVKRLSTMQIGKPAAVAFQQGMAPGRIVVVQAAGAAAGEAAAAAAAAAQPEPAAAEGVVPAIDEGRYVDAEGKKLPAGQAAQQQFKRMPVYLRLTIDQRQIHKLLTECANSPLPLEVHQLRIGGKDNRAATDTAAKAAQGTTVQESYDVPLELNGIIYLYNPPDAAKLGSPAATAGAPTAGTPGGM